MTNKLTNRQRSQALGWCSVMGFSAIDLADHFGLTPDEMAVELVEARKMRQHDGKSSEPVPVRHKPGEAAPTHTQALAECVMALQAIVRTRKTRGNTAYAWKLSAEIAKKALFRVGFLP